MSCSCIGDAMARMRPLSLRRFAADTRGAQLVEFAIVLPLMLVLFGVIIEGGRMMWSYQTVVSGVRDATRFLARVTPRDACDTGVDVAAYSDLLATMVRTSSSGGVLLPDGITVDGVTPVLACNPGDYRSEAAPVVTVSADITVTFPFAGLFTLVDGSLTGFSTTVSDQSRVYGS
ncbi:MAG: TadE/TadG family type IV pilus assembly protein [Paracoccaceae bacterium]